MQFCAERRHCAGLGFSIIGIDPAAYFAIGDADAILGRIAAYVNAGISKFILRPVAQGDADIMAQTERLVAEVLPEVARWPKPGVN